MFYRFMLITQKQEISDDKYFDFIKQCADGGITSVQLREKHLDIAQLTTLGENLMTILAPYNIPLVINDFPLLAKELGTPYIHVGQTDESINNTKKLIPNACIGLSIENEAQLHQANIIDNLSYLTASAVFPSQNKNNLTKIWGLEGLQELSTMSKHPLTAIGGITLENVEEVIHHGAKGIALIGAIHDSTNPYQICKEFSDILSRNLP